MCKAKYLAHTEPLFKMSKVLTLKQMINLSCVQFIHKCLNSTIYQNIRPKLIQNQEIHTYFTRNRESYRPYNVRLDISKNAFINKGIGIWNDLSDEIRSISTLHLFKVKIKNKYFE